jgi:hypothetical protein
MSANAEIIAELRRVLNERDEARKQLDLTKRELGRWVDRETKAVRERDEARAERDLARERFENAVQTATRYVIERDEARAEVERLRAAVHTRACRNQSAYNLNCVCGADERQRDLQKLAYRRGAEAMRKRCEEIARHACSVIGGLEHTYGLMTPGHVETVSRLILEADIPEEP